MVNALMLQIGLTVLLLLFVTGQGLPAIKLGIVYSLDSDYEHAWLGYTFYVHKINSQGGLVVGPPGNETIYTLSLIRHFDNIFEDPYWNESGSGIGYTGSVNKQWIWTNGRSGAPSEQDRHWWQLQRLWKEDFVDFILGGTSSHALNETMTTSQQNIINMLCCVGPVCGFSISTLLLVLMYTNYFYMC